ARHAHHRRRPRDRPRAPPAPGDGRGHRRRGAGDSRRTGSPRDHDRGPPRGSSASRHGRRRAARRDHRRRDARREAGVNQYRRLLSYLRPYLWPQGVAAVAFMLAFSGIESSVPFLAKFTFDQVFTQHHDEALGWAVVGAVVVGLLRGGLTFVTGYLTDWIGGRVVADLRNQAIGHLQTLDVGFFNRQRAGQIVSRVMADVALVRSAVTDAVTSIFQDTTSLIGLIAVAFYMDWVLAILGLILFP